MIVLWSSEQTEHVVSDSLVLRQFCRLSLEAVPDETTLLRWANLIGPPTSEQLNERVVQLARALNVTRGRKLRLDSMVVETTIHSPTDSRILGDEGRVLSRLLRRAKDVIDESTELSKETCRSRTRRVRRLTQHLHRVARRKGDATAEELKGAYRKLIEIAEARRAQAEQARARLQEQADKTSQRLMAGASSRDSESTCR